MAPNRGRVSRSDVHFDFDAYLNPFLPPNPIKHFPKTVARFLGHRKEPAKPLGNILISLWALVGAFIGLLVTAACYKFSNHLQSFHPPILFASLGATAILDYNTIQSPLAQPRAAIVGHGLAAIVGVAISKLFELSSDPVSLRWLAGPVACAVASFVMSMTNTVHPPGGATAVLAAIDPTTIRMGWMFVPFIMLGSVLMFGVACLINNIQRQFPVFWWTPQPVGMWWRRHKTKDVEGRGSSVSDDEEEEKAIDVVEHKEFKQAIILTPDKILIPEGMVLERNTRQILQMLRATLKERRDEEEADNSNGPKHDIARVASEVSHGSDHTHVDSDRDSSLRYGK